MVCCGCGRIRVSLGVDEDVVVERALGAALSGLVDWALEGQAHVIHLNGATLSAKFAVVLLDLERRRANRGGGGVAESVDLQVASVDNSEGVFGVPVHGDLHAVRGVAEQICTFVAAGIVNSRLNDCIVGCAVKDLFLRVEEGYTVEEAHNRDLCFV